MNWNSDKTYHLIGGILFIAFLWYFTDIVVYIIISSILGVALQPIMKLLKKIKIKNKQIPNGIAAALSMTLFILIISGLLGLLVPAINAQATDLSKVNFQEIASAFNKSAHSVELYLHKVGILSHREHLEQYIAQNISSIINEIQINNLFSNIVAVTGNLLMAVFSILFMTFFFTEDDELFQRIVLLFVKEQNIPKTSIILKKVNRMLSRYFLGLAIEISSMMLLISIGGWILGLKNALLIGFLGGLMNLIPYIGPIIGATIGSILVAMTNIYLGIDHTLALIGGILIVFAAANLIDNIVLQPIIYSNSVHAHPMEIFIVIIMAGQLGGPLAMIAAIPIYTVIRISAKEFLGDKEFVKRLMKDV